MFLKTRIHYSFLALIFKSQLSHLKPHPCSGVKPNPNLIQGWNRCRCYHRRHRTGKEPLYRSWGRRRFLYPSKHDDGPPLSLSALPCFMVAVTMMIGCGIDDGRSLVLTVVLVERRRRWCLPLYVVILYVVMMMRGSPRRGKRSFCVGRNAHSPLLP
jgi:hypothetical protein